MRGAGDEMDIEEKDDEEGGDLTHGGDSILVREDEKGVRGGC